MSKKLILFTLFIVVGLVFYYSWIPDQRLTSETYLPQWLLDWSNKYYNLRTAVPFVAFGNLLQAYSMNRQPSHKIVNTNLIFMQNLAVAGIVACIAEGGQFMVKDRSPDIMDIYFAIIGSLVGATLYNLFNKRKVRNA